MRILRNRRGMTLIEAVITGVIISMVSVALLAMTSQSLSGWSSGMSHVNATNSATIAVQKLQNDIRDARNAVGSGTLIVVYYPATVVDATTGEQSYDLSATDPITRTYYLSNGNLMRQIGTASATVFARGVVAPSGVTNPLSAQNGEVNVNLMGSDQTGSKKATETVNCRISLRNFRY